jgi:hypothetical protein
MQEKAPAAHFEALKDSSGASVEVNLHFIGDNGQLNRRLHQCIDELPHGGSVGSIFSRLPYSTVDVCRKHTVGVVRLARMLDGAMPDATRLRIMHASVCQRALLIQVRGFVSSRAPHA